MKRNYFLLAIVILLMFVFSSGFIVAELCYQESANVSTACGGLDTGNYDITDNPYNNMDQVIDGNWETWGGWGSAYVNYTKPNNFIGAIWQVKDYGGTVNLTLPEECLSYSNTVLEVLAISSPVHASWRCFNGISWISLREDSTGGNIYEEAMIWDIDYFPNIQIVYPLDDTNTLNTNININYMVSDDRGISSCWYSNDSYSVNTFLPNCQNITNINWSEGQHDVTIWVNDSSNNINWSKITFRVFPTVPEYIQWGNESNLNVNSSSWWDSIDGFNLTQITITLGKLTLSESWLTSFISSLINYNYVLGLGFYPSSNPSNFYNASTLPQQSGTSFKYYNLTTADVVTGNSVNYNTTVLSLPLTAGKKISIECNLLVDSVAATTGIQLSSNVSSTSSRRQNIEYYTSTTAQAICQGTTDGLLCTSTASAGTTTTPTRINIYTVQQNNSQFVLKLKSEVTNSNVYVRTGSWCRSLEI